MDQIIKDLKEENDGIQIEIKAMQTQNKATIADLKSQNDNVQFAKEKLQYDNLMMRNENSMLTEKIAKKGTLVGSRVPMKLSSATYRTLSCMVLGTISDCENVQFAKEKLQNALLRFERDPGGIQGP